jgi:aminopeptidase 2
MCRRDADAMGANLDIAKGREVLPKNVKPLHYHLTLEPNLETFEYEGKVVIEYVSSIVRLWSMLWS